MARIVLRYGFRVSRLSPTSAYFDTADTLGFLVEAVEPPAQMPPMDFVLQLT